jgi:hypothetical protein
MWWLLGGIAAVLLAILLWSAGSYLYLKLTYPRRSEQERRRFEDLSKEERMPPSSS